MCRNKDGRTESGLYRDCAATERTPMLNAIEISPKVWWVGGLDWSERHFHGYTTERGITYNAYLIMDETVTLIDTAKSTFTDEFVQRISQVVDPAKIELVVTNHVEMDHSGSPPPRSTASPPTPASSRARPPA